MYKVVLERGIYKSEKKRKKKTTTQQTQSNNLNQETSKMYHVTEPYAAVKH